MEAAIAKASPSLVPPGATKVLPHNASQRVKPKRITSAQVWLLARRMLVLGAAVLYVYTLLQGGTKAIEVLYGVVDDSVKFEVMRCDLIVSYAGQSAIRTSPLVDALGGSFIRNDTMYLLSENAVSFNSCGAGTAYNRNMYSNTFLRTQFSDLVRDTSYNLSLFKTSDLVVPIVDCTSTILLEQITTYMRVFYLVRSKTDPTALSLISYSFSMQDYRFPDQYQTGVTGMLLLTVVSDMRFQNVDATYFAMALAYPFRKPAYAVYLYQDDTPDGFRIFESIPTSATDVSRVIYTSWRTGIFTSQSETEQSNVKNINAVYKSDPEAALSEWEWQGISLVHDAWTWTHVIHFIFAVDMIFSILVLLLVIYRNLCKGKFWIGDAFVSVSRSVTLRGLLILLAWYLDGFWALMEFCLQEGKILSNAPPMFIHEAIIHADFLVIYLSLAGLLGMILHERIDPALAVFLFEIGFANRHSIIQWFPKALEVVIDFYLTDATKGVVPVPTKLAGISPLRFRTTHVLHSKSVSVVFAVCAPVFLTFAVLLVYVPIRKLHRRFFPDRMIQLSRGTNLSTESDAILAWNHKLTMFEVATGAALQNRVGLVSDYDNCVYIKGMKFASADGIFCNGFVVANGKWLVRMIELPLVLMMIVLRVRFADVYVYEVETYTVQNNARLFYPEMLTFRELFQLNTMVLA